MHRNALAFATSLGLISLGAFIACGDDDDDSTPPPATKKTSGKSGSSGASGAGGGGGASGSDTGGSGGTAGSAGTAGAGGNPSPDTLDSFAAQYPPAYCAVGAPCCKAKNLNGDQSACEKGLNDQINLIRSTATYDKDQGKACLDQLKALAGNATACATLDQGIEACTKALTLPNTNPPGKNPGDTCADSSECAPPAQGDVRCEEVGLEPKKICQQVLDGQSGATPCIGDARQTIAVNDDPKVAVGTVYRCVVGFRCDVGTRVCGAPVAIGGDCIASFDCAPDSYCASGKCAAAVADGAACEDDDQCKSTSFCSGNKTCTPYLAANAPCTPGDPNGRCQSGACVNGKCSAPAGTQQPALYCAP